MPSTPSVGETVNVVPLQVVTLIGEMMIVGVSETVTVNGAPVPQLTVFGVTV